LDINQETVNDLAKRLMHRIIARKLATDPAMIDRARAEYADLDPSNDEIRHVREWKRILEMDPAEIRCFLTSRGERGDWLRPSSPFVFASEIEALGDVPTRRRIWRAAKRVAMTKARREMEEAARAVPAAS